jgi:hypothetical protein
MRKGIVLLTLILLMFATRTLGQQNAGGRTNPNVRPSANAAGSPASARRLSDGYRGVILGMDLSKAREILKKDRLLEIDVRSDFGDLDEEPYHVLKARNVPYIKSIYYQFGTTASVKRKLFAIIIHFNHRYNDFYRLLNKMKKKYGEPDLHTPTSASWYNSKIKIILNSPSTVKYIEIELYRKMQSEYSYMRHRYFPQTDDAASTELTNDL